LVQLKCNTWWLLVVAVVAIRLVLMLVAVEVGRVDLELPRACL
jgi:hypothetical protein